MEPNESRCASDSCPAHNARFAARPLLTINRRQSKAWPPSARRFSTAAFVQGLVGGERPEFWGVDFFQRQGRAEPHQGRWTRTTAEGIQLLHQQW